MMGGKCECMHHCMCVTVVLDDGDQLFELK